MELVKFAQKEIDKIKRMTTEQRTRKIALVFKNY